MTPPNHPDFVSAVEDATSLSADQLLIQTYAATRVLMERTADLPEIKAKVSRHDSDINMFKWLGGGAVSAVFTIFLAWVKSHFFPSHS